MGEGEGWDLVYAPRAWEVLVGDEVWKEGGRVVFYQCGGAEGNASQIARYKYKGMWDE